MNITKSTPAGYDPERLHAVRVREDALFRTRIPHSLDLAARARRSMPDGVPIAWMASLYRHPPLFVVEVWTLILSILGVCSWQTTESGRL
jgi:hypothetical protein